MATGASAAYTPKLVVSLSTPDVSQPVDVTLDFSQSASDSPTARVAIYVPTGFSMNLTATAGSTVGTATVGTQGSAAVPGTVTVDDPATHTADACSPGTSQAVWLVTTSALTFPVYVNATTGAEAALGPFRLVACFGTTRPTQIVLTLKKVFTNPSGGNFERAFTAAATPYDASNQASPTDAAFAYGIVRIPVEITLTPRYAAKSGKTIASGIVQETALARGIPRAKVKLFGGATVATEKPLGTVTANSKGQFTWSQKGSSLKSFHAELLPSVRDATKYDCNSSSVLATLAPRGCVNATIGPVAVTSESVPVRRTKR